MQPAKPTADDNRWLAAAAALADARGHSPAPTPAWARLSWPMTYLAAWWWGAGGRALAAGPHAEAAALAQAGAAARGGTLYVTLEPCAHTSPRGPACADLVAASGLARVVVGMEDPDPRTAGTGMARIGDAGIEVALAGLDPAMLGLSGHACSALHGRPHVTLKLALSLDGCIALADGASQWITGEPARAFAHRERARADAILVGGGTLRADAPRLDVRLAGLEGRSPNRLVLTRGEAPAGWHKLAAPEDITALTDTRYLMIEGGAGAAAAFLAADLVDRLLIIRAPIIIGGGVPSVGDIGLGALADAHGRWRNVDSRMLGKDRLDSYERVR